VSLNCWGPDSDPVWDVRYTQSLVDVIFGVDVNVSVALTTEMLPHCIVSVVCRSRIDGFTSAGLMAYELFPP
jgi:hypothetical protein